MSIVFCVCFQLCLLVQRVELLADFLQITNGWVILAKRSTNYNRGPDSRFLPAITVASTTSRTSTPLSTLPSLSSSPSSITLTLTSVDQGQNSGTSTPIYPPPPPSTPLLPPILPINDITQTKPQPASWRTLETKTRRGRRCIRPKRLPQENTTLHNDDSVGRRREEGRLF